jgi:hypothetical protein
MTCGYGIDAIDATRTPRSSGCDAPSIRMISFSTSLFKAIAWLKRKKIGSYKSHTIAIVNCAEVIAHECGLILCRLIQVGLPQSPLWCGRTWRTLGILLSPEFQETQLTSAAATLRPDNSIYRNCFYAPGFPQPVESPGYIESFSSAEQTPNLADSSPGVVE